MSNENVMPPENVISIEKISAEFAQIYGEQIGKLLMEKINLQGIVGQLQAQNAALSEKIQRLENGTTPQSQQPEVDVITGKPIAK